MGIQDRDYYRESSRGFLDAWNRKGAVVWLIAVTTVVFFAQCFTHGPARSELTQYGCFSKDLILGGEVWRLVTPLFLHMGLLHLFWNMLVLYWAGSQVEELYGNREFLCFYLIGGALIHLLYLALQVADLVGPQQAVGASSIVTAVLVVFAFHYPHHRVLLFMILPVPVWLIVVLYVGMDLMSFGGGGRMAVIGSLSGAFYGLVYHQSGFRFTNLFSVSPRTGAHRAKPVLRLVPAESESREPVGAGVQSQPRPVEADEHLEAKLDRILEKVSLHGQESLTPEEREILLKASELYKKRRR